MDLKNVAILLSRNIKIYLNTKKSPCKSGFEVAKLDISHDLAATKSAPAVLLKSGLNQSPYAFVKIYGRIWKAWNLMIILKSNSLRLERKSPCKWADYFEGI